MSIITQGLLGCLDENYKIKTYNFENANYFDSNIHTITKKIKFFKSPVVLTELKDNTYSLVDEKEPNADMMKILEELKEISESIFGSKDRSYIILCKSNKKLKPKYYFNGINLYAHFLIYNEVENEIYFENKFVVKIGTSVKKLAKLLTSKILETN